MYGANNTNIDPWWANGNGWNLVAPIINTKPCHIFFFDDIAIHFDYTVDLTITATVTSGLHSVTVSKKLTAGTASRIHVMHLGDAVRSAISQGYYTPYFDSAYDVRIKIGVFNGYATQYNQWDGWCYYGRTIPEHFHGAQLAGWGNLYNPYQSNYDESTNSDDRVLVSPWKLPSVGLCSEPFITEKMQVVYGIQQGTGTEVVMYPNNEERTQWILLDEYGNPILTDAEVTLDSGTIAVEDYHNYDVVLRGMYNTTETATIGIYAIEYEPIFFDTENGNDSINYAVWSYGQVVYVGYSEAVPWYDPLDDCPYNFALTEIPAPDGGTYQLYKPTYCSLPHPDSSGSQFYETDYTITIRSAYYSTCNCVTFGYTGKNGYCDACDSVQYRSLPEDLCSTANLIYINTDGMMQQVPVEVLEVTSEAQRERTPKPTLGQMEHYATPVATEGRYLLAVKDLPVEWCFGDIAYSHYIDFNGLFCYLVPESMTINLRKDTADYTFEVIVKNNWQ